MDPVRLSPNCRFLISFVVAIAFRYGFAALHLKRRKVDPRKGAVTAEEKLREIRGYREMGALLHAFRSKQVSVDTAENVT